MRTIPESLDPAVVSEIDARLDGLGVAIPWAIESGSRAWGFPSPDSDYDCRFFFVRGQDDYLTPWPKRDVIETPLDKIFDVNGWDLIKAVRLLLRGNAVVTEWLRSPIVYTGDQEFRNGFLELAAQVSNRALIGRHYFHIGRNQWNSRAEDMSLKKIFYSLRPAAVLRWMADHPDAITPPMNLLELLAETDVPADLLAETEELLALKAVTREIGTGQVPPSIARFVDEEFERADASFERSEAWVAPESRDLASVWFREAVEKYGR